MGPSNEEIIHGLADNLPFGVWVARAPGGEFVYANATFAEIMGMTARGDVAVGEYAEPYGIYDRRGRLYPEDRMPFVQALKAGREVVVDDIVIHRHDGRKVYIRATARPVFNGKAISHVVVAFIDISREVAAEAARRETESRLRVGQRMESLGNLAGGIAHDFNNLLAVVKALASALHATETDPDRRSDLETIDEATRRAADLTRSLLRFAGGQTPGARSVDLSLVVRRTAWLLERSLDRRITITVDTAPTAWVSGDETQMEQVVMNLTLNARDAMEGDGEIVLLTYEDGDEVVLEVADTGPGLDEALRERIFEPYFTSKQKSSNRGTGLGLSIVHGIVTSHGGRIEVKGRPGGGSRFIVFFPAAHVGGSGETPVPKDAAAPDYQGTGIALIVDDETPVRRAAERLLTGLGFEVLAAAGGREALRLFARHGRSIRFVLLDVTMPDMDGKETLIALRAAGLEAPVVITTGYSLGTRALPLLDAGAKAFLPKPFGRAELVEVLAEHLPMAEA